MDALEMDLLAGVVDALASALELERFRHVAGIDGDPVLGSAFEAHGRAAHKQTVAALREAGNADLADRVAALRAERSAAGQEEAWRAADARASGRGVEAREPLAALEAALPRERDRTRRGILARGAAEALADAASAREEWAEVRARARAEVGLAPDWRAVVEGDQVLSASDDAWRDVSAWAERRALGEGAAEGLSRADLLHVLALARWDGLFRAGMLPVALKLTLEGLGLDLARIRVDDAARAAKWPGAHAVGARVSFRPRGGAGDWQDLLAAAARALAAAAVPASRRDPALPEALAWILGSLALEPRWLAARAGAERRDAPDLVRELALRRLFALRCDAAALRVATEVDRGLSGNAWREAHREALTTATGATWDAARASRDADASALAARIRGAAEGERLRAELLERFDEDWWRNPRTAAWLGTLLERGRLPETDAPPPAADAARALVARLDGGG
jgi:hypothetical protein